MVYLRKAVGYISCYKKNEIEREVELKVQKERIQEFCKQNTFEFYDIYEEPLESTEDYKSELFRLLDNAGKGEFQYVIVLSLDRIAYDNVAKVWVANELKKNGIKLYSLTENMALSPNTDNKIIEKSEQIKERVRDIPSLPEIVNKVIELVQNPNSSAFQLSKLISNDAGLTARVLKLVNSAYYGFPKQISSIQHSIAILGFTTIKGLVLSSSIFKVFAPKENSGKMLDYKKLWKHSLLCAIISKQINNVLKIQDNENLFSASILHDMGKIILDQYDHGNYIMALTDCSDTDLLGNLTHEKKYCGLNHCEVGALISEHWNLPEGITETLRYHHCPQEAALDYQKTAAIVGLANIFTVLIEKEIELEPDYFKNIDTNILNLDVSAIYDLFALVKDKIKDEQNLDEFFA